jgi:hypothetical protein
MHVFAHRGSDQNSETDAAADLSNQRSNFGLVRLYPTAWKLPEQRQYGLRIALSN